MREITVLPGDGIGGEVMAEAVKVLKAASDRFDFECNITEYEVGGISIDKFGVPIKEEVLEKSLKSDTVLLGAIGAPAYDNLPYDVRPEAALLALREGMEVYSNLRPIQVFPQLMSASTMKEETIKNVDMLIIRELTGGLYFGQPRFIEEQDGEEHAVDTMEYSTNEVERIAHYAFKAARNRRKKVTSVDKANMLLTSRLWRKVVKQVAEDYPDIELNHLLVDNAAMQLVRDPEQFDVLLTENTFGDILSDQAAMISGSLGMLPSASIGESKGLYEPCHGSAPDIMGKNMANPIAMINSVAMMFRFQFRMEEAASCIENAVNSALEQGYRTRDIYSVGTSLVDTDEMGEIITGLIK